MQYTVQLGVDKGTQYLLVGQRVRSLPLSTNSGVTLQQLRTATSHYLPIRSQ